MKFDWLSLARRAVVFEEKLAEIIGRRRAIAASNGTSTLPLAMTALDIGNESVDQVVEPLINLFAAINIDCGGGRKINVDR